jgi:uncharacterized membrane protein YphA (DoxX/SURF4 family)
LEDGSPITGVAFPRLADYFSIDTTARTQRAVRLAFRPRPLWFSAGVRSPSLADKQTTNERTCMKNLNEWKIWIQNREDLFKDLVRMYLGIGLFVKGLYFMSNRDELNLLLGRLDNATFLQAAASHYVIPVHVIGGLLLAIGLLTRFAALLQIPILLGAVFYVYLPTTTLTDSRQSLEFSALVLFLLVLVVAYGAGRFSVDQLLWKKDHTHAPARLAA